MKKHRTITEERVRAEEKAPKLAAEDADETTQQIEEAAYYIGLNRRNNSHPGDELNDWYEAEKAVKEDLE